MTNEYHADSQIYNFESSPLATKGTIRSIHTSRFWVRKSTVWPVHFDTIWYVDAYRKFDVLTVPYLRLQFRNGSSTNELKMSLLVLFESSMPTRLNEFTLAEPLAGRV